MKKTIDNHDDAVRQAIDECIKKGILSEFLRRNRAEVELTSIFEYNQEEEERKLRAAERQAGYVEGYDSGMERGTAENLYKLVRNFMSRRKVTLEEACDALGISADDYNKAKRITNEHKFS